MKTLQKECCVRVKITQNLVQQNAQSRSDEMSLQKEKGVATMVNSADKEQSSSS